MSQENAVMKFFETPVLLENLLPYLDSGSTLCLAQSKISCILGLLQKTTDTENGTVEWNKLVQRSLPEDFKIGWGGRGYFTRVRESYEENRAPLLTLISILKMMDDKTAANTHMLHLLDVICLKGFPDERQGYVPRNEIKIGCPRHSDHSVSPLAFLLLETVEAAFDTAIQQVAELVFIPAVWYSFEEPLLSAVAARVARQQQQMKMMKPAMVYLKTKASAEALLTLIKASAMGGDHLFPLILEGSIGAEGWAAVAEASTLAPGCVTFLTANHADSVDWMREARREDLRAIWDRMGGNKVVIVGGVRYFLTEEGRREALEKVLDNNQGHVVTSL